MNKKILALELKRAQKAYNNNKRNDKSAVKRRLASAVDSQIARIALEISQIRNQQHLNNTFFSQQVEKIQQDITKKHIDRKNPHVEQQ